MGILLQQRPLCAMRNSFGGCERPRWGLPRVSSKRLVALFSANGHPATHPYECALVPNLYLPSSHCQKRIRYCHVAEDTFFLNILAYGEVIARVSCNLLIDCDLHPNYLEGLRPVQREGARQTHGNRDEGLALSPLSS